MSFWTWFWIQNGFCHFAFTIKCAEKSCESDAGFVVVFVTWRDRTQTCYLLSGGALLTSCIADAGISLSLIRVLSWQRIHLTFQVWACRAAWLKNLQHVIDCVWLISAFCKQGWGKFLHELPTIVGVVGERNFITLTWAWLRAESGINFSLNKPLHIC